MPRWRAKRMLPGHVAEMTHLPDPFQTPAAGLDEAIGDVERQFGLLVISARTSIRNRAAAIHPELPPLGYKILTLLNHSTGRQQVELAEELQADKAMMSRTIRQMVGFGLVECAADPADGRAKLVSSTETARRRYEQSIAASRKLLHDRLSTWEKSEVERFAELLARLTEASGGNATD